MTGIAVVVTCHEPYLRWLAGTLASVDRQSPPALERVVVLDGCTPPADLPTHWRAVTGQWGSAAGARNAGLSVVTTPWVVFFDADDVMPSEYLAAVRRAIEGARPNVAIIYPDLQYCDDELRPRSRRDMPPWSYWSLRAENYVSTAGAWRRTALLLAGGWSTRAGAFDDFAAALDVTAAGWHGAKLDGPAVIVRQHPDSQLQSSRSAGQWLTDIWRARSLAIVTLHAGRLAGLTRWRDFLLGAELPPKTSVYVVDNGGDPEFTRRLAEACEQIREARDCIKHVDISQLGERYRDTPGDPYLAEGRHEHVARLYASVLPRVTEDLVLTLEDDMDPPPTAIRALGEQIGYPSRASIGAVAAAYAMPYDEHLVCAGLGTDNWGTSVDWAKLTDVPLDVGYVGGGCTMWANWALQEAALQLDWQRWLGWDAMLCQWLRLNGYRVQLHGGVRALHHIDDRFDAAQAPAGEPDVLPSPEETYVGGPDQPPGEGPSLEDRFAELRAEWQAKATGGDFSTPAPSVTPDTGAWEWQHGALRARGEGREWAALEWPSIGPAVMADIASFVIGVTVTGQCEAAGLSFGPYKDFLTRTDGRGRRLQVEVDSTTGTWSFRVDGALMQRTWWDAAVHSSHDLTNGTLTFKGRRVADVRFSDFSIDAYESSCQLSIVLCCYRFLQRLRISLRAWCAQIAPSGSYEVLVVNPSSPDGTHEHLAAVAASHPDVRVREIVVDPEFSTNKGTMINAAVEQCRGDWIWLTDADCLFPTTAVAEVLKRIGSGGPRLWYGRRHHLSPDQTSALLAGRLDPVRDFASLAETPSAKPPDNRPWGYTQIVPRKVIREIRYRADIGHFAWSDDVFWSTCQARGVRPDQMEGLVCLHMDHPFSWYGTPGFL